ncbi:MAG: ABC transporter permease, partial [bacterium]|nr:ABC transporter permease [bacterium]
MSRGRRNRVLAWPAGTVLVVVYILALCADFVAPYNYARQHRTVPYAPPTSVHFVDADGVFHWRPFVHAIELGTGGDYLEDHSRIFPLRFGVRDPEGGRRLFGVDPPGQVFLLGSDRFGRDLLSRWLYGARISLFAGLLAGALAVALGLAIGAVAGYFGGWIDEILMRAAELFMALPWIYLLIAVRAFLPLHITPVQAFGLLVTLIGLVGWAAPARLVRGVVLSAKERDYVLAARGFGASPAYLLARHVLPRALPVALTQFALLVPSYILAEVTLSFLGLGVAEPVPSWGNLLAELQQYHVLVSHGWM